MFEKSFFAAMGFFLVLPKDQLLAQGASGVVFLNDRRQVTGELLAVRVTAILIDTLVGRPEDTTVAPVAGVISVRRETAQKVRVKGESFRLKGTLIGVAIGASAGAVIGLASGDDEPKGFQLWTLTAGQKALLFGAGLGVLGALIGGVVGAARSSKDKEYDPSVDEAWVGLRAAARYPDKEPEFLKEIK